VAWLVFLHWAMNSAMSFFVFVFVPLLPVALSGWAAPLEASAKVSTQERQQISETAAVNAHRAYLPTQASVAKLLATDAEVEDACPACSDKDYSDLCPLGWTELQDGWCAAPATYVGACEKMQAFISSSVAAKMEAEIACGVCWPCARGGGDDATCARDWSRPCPNGYSPQDISHHDFNEAGGVTCMADFTYEGQCEQQVVFKDARAKQSFAERCQTSWPCRAACKDSDEPCKSFLSSRLEHVVAPGPRKSLSFLAARVLPVDAYKVRNSLFLSQLLRMPAAASVNIVEQEDASRMYEEAKYKSMEGQASRLDRSLASKLRLLSQKM